MAPVWEGSMSHADAPRPASGNMPSCGWEDAAGDGGKGESMYKVMLIDDEENLQEAIGDTVISGWKEFRTKELFSTQK